MTAPRIPRDPIDMSWSLTALAVCGALLLVAAVIVGTLAAAMVWAYMAIMGVLM